METPSPYSLLAELTYRCPLQCPYCSNPVEMSRYAGELETRCWKRVLSEASSLGIVQVHFSGGEPLLRDDLEDLVAHARSEDLYCHLITSGVKADEKRLGQLKEAGLDAIQISLQDSRQEESDWLAGARSFEIKQSAVQAAREQGFPITLNIVLHRHNLGQLEEMIELARQWKVDKLELAHVQYAGWALRNRAALLPTAEMVTRSTTIVERARQSLAGQLEIVHVLPDYFQQFPKACLHGWGRVFLTVSPDGSVLPCQTAREIPGLQIPTVEDGSLEEIWFQDPLFQRFRGTDWMPEPCRSCDRREIDFGGCRCQAFLVTGDLSATDPVCHLSPKRFLIDEAISESETAERELVFRSGPDGF